MADPSGPTVSDHADDAGASTPEQTGAAPAGDPATSTDAAPGGDGRVGATGTVAGDRVEGEAAAPSGVAGPDPVGEGAPAGGAVGTGGTGPSEVGDDPTVAAGGDDHDHDHGDGDELDADDDLDDGEPPRKGSLLTRQVQIDARTILIIAAVMALGVGAYVLGQKQAGDEAGPAATATSGPPSTVFELPKDFVPFDDKETGIQLAVPKDWVAYSTKDLDRSYRLLVGVPKAKDNLRVRMNAYSTPVTAQNIRDQQAVVDAIFAEEKIQVLARELPTVNGMPALYYAYKFTDATGEPGFHAHFFVFQGRKMVSLVFEAVPEARFTELAPVFDQVTNSLVVAPGDPPSFLQEPTGTGATPPGSTTPSSTTPSSAP